MSDTDINTWQWRLFSAPEIPEGAGGRIGADVLPLPDGREVQGREFAFPPSGIADLNRIADEPLPPRSRVVLTADFTAERKEKFVLGCGADWWFTLYFNGEAVYSTSERGNIECRIRPGNHFVVLECRAGSNRLVCEVAGGDENRIFAAQILPYVPLGLTCEPWAHFPDAETGAMTVTFVTNRPAPAGIDLRLAGEEAWQRHYDTVGGQIRRDRTIHHVRLTGLRSDCRYEYRVVLADEYDRLTETALPEVHGFCTAPEGGRPFSFVATSDVQLPHAERKDWLERFFRTPSAQAADFFAFLGDVNWVTDFEKDYLDELVVPVAAAAENRKPLLFLRGNHEMYGRAANRFFDYFAAPAPGREGYGMFRWGDVCFFHLDFGDDFPRQEFPYARALNDVDPYLDAEAEWLKRAVDDSRCRTAKYRVVLAHGVPIGDLNLYMPGNIRRVIDPVFGGRSPRCRIHLWLGGHVHYPLRSQPLRNAWRSYHDLRRVFPERPAPRDGSGYAFPVVVLSGPRRQNPPELQVSGAHVSVSDAGIDVRCCDRKGVPYDHIRIAVDGSVTELERAGWFEEYEY